MKKKQIILPVILVLTLILSACTAQTGGGGNSSGSSDADSRSAVPVKITAEEAYEQMNSGDPVVVVDVRTAEEYTEKHIPGAILIPNEEIGQTPPAQLPVLDANILLYCRSGNRSAQAAEKLADLGYSRVSDFGGINDWPYETESGEYKVSEKEGTLSSFTAYDLNGMAVDETVFADYDLTMINIWATYCGFCLNEMPELGQIAAEYREKGVQVMGIVVDIPQDSDGSYPGELVGTARDLVSQTGAEYLHLLPSPDLSSAKLDQVSSVPETIFVNSRGEQVGKSYPGARSGEEWESILDSLLKEVKK